MAGQTNAVMVKFRLTRSEAFSVFAWNNVRKMWYLLLVPILGAISIVWAILDPANSVVNLNGGLGCLVGGAFLFGVLPYVGTLAVMKHPNFGGVMTLTVSAAGIHLTGEHSSATADWLMVKGFSEVNHAILINMKPVGFHIVPKDQVSPAVWRRSRVS
jgi:hypothetical protein